MQAIKGYSTFSKIEVINKGWSSDKKFYIETTEGKKLLLRTADISEYQRKKSEYEMMKQVAALGVPMSQPVDFGICNDGKEVYQLLTWCEGKDAELVLPSLTETQQYVLGIKAGEILRKLHSIPAPKEQEEWGSRFNRKTNNKIKKYKECGLKFDGDEKIISYLENNRYLLSGRPQCYQHGDYHVGNMIISPENSLFIIDFNRPDFGDPWEEFNRIVWSATVSPHFATGQINGYFNGTPPIEFFKLLAFYISSNTLSSIYWAISFGQEEITTMKNQARDVLSWFDNMNNPIPTWYLEKIYVQYIDNVPYRLKVPFDMSFIQKYGKVFKIYDGQDSGNICFGVENGENKYFIKFAGAPTEQYPGRPEEAITRLKTTVSVYRDLTHPNLIKFTKAEEIGGGFAMIFEWTDGQCMGRMYPQSRQKFLQMSYNIRLEVFDDILSFHAEVIDKGYVAIDFYDGSIMYDFDEKKTVICDIDFYSKQPYINCMGRMWGSSRFMSPEEYKVGEVIDELTNVYLMGATAFALFSDYHRSFEEWKLTEELYKVALKAVSNDRKDRQQSIKQFIKEWKQAQKTTMAAENEDY
jgi:serine/threonine-protein kinase